MKETFLMFAKYNRETNRTIYSILDKLSNEDREKPRGSYYGSLSALFRHLMGGTQFFMGLYTGALTGKAAALKVLEPIAQVQVPEGPLSAAQWKDLDAALETVDSTLVNLVSALEEGDLALPLKINWYGGNPGEVPLSFMLNQLLVHGTHHRGQLSQILDELKIDHDYSGISPAFLP